METARECARLISENKDMIISQWEEEVREEILASNASTTVALRNELPALLEDVANIFIEKSETGFDHKTDKYLQTVDKNRVHGKERAESEYSIEQVLQEYLILQRIVTERLQERGLLTVDLANLLKYIFARTVINVVGSYAIHVQYMQDKVIGALAHDIRNPLTTALSSIQMMAQMESKNERLIELARKGVTRSIDLTEGLLDTISLYSGQGMMMHFSESDYCQVLRETCEEVSEIYQTKTLCDVPEGAVLGTFDTSAIKRVLDNLISNAVKHGDKDSDINLILEETPDEVQLSVQNQGDPIPEEKQKSIFNFLSQSEDQNFAGKDKGWGIGLALVKLIVDAHNGRIDLKSNKAEGTIFTIWLKRKLKHTGKIRVKFS